MQAFENALLDQIKEILVADRLDDSKVKVVVEVLKVIFDYFEVLQTLVHYVIFSFIKTLVEIIKQFESKSFLNF